MWYSVENSRRGSWIIVITNVFVEVLVSKKTANYMTILLPIYIPTYDRYISLLLMTNSMGELAINLQRHQIYGSPRKPIDKPLGTQQKSLWNVHPRCAFAIHIVIPTSCRNIFFCWRPNLFAAMVRVTRHKHKWTTLVPIYLGLSPSKHEQSGKE